MKALLPAVATTLLLAAAPAQEPAPASPPPVGAVGPVEQVAITLSLLTAVGASSERDATLAELKGGAHDPRQRGFTLQQAELGITGRVSPWFDAAAYVIASIDVEGETVVELEEAFLTTRELPAGLELRAGTFFTEFGRHNARHPHEWDWTDQPFVLTRVFGGDGQRAPGARLAWQVPDLPLRVLGGVQNATGETMPSFLGNEEVWQERGIGGRSTSDRDVRGAGDLVWLLRAATAWQTDPGRQVEFGASVLYGPNATGGDADTLVHGVDFEWREQWRGASPCCAVPRWSLQAEYLHRVFDAAEQIDDSDPLLPVTLPASTLHDHGGYLQVQVGLAAEVAVGLRGEWASGSGASYRGAGTFDRAADAFRCDRVRLSPLLAWRPSHQTSVRLQYDWDDSDHLGREAHSVWIGVELLLGSHAPHGVGHAGHRH